MVEFLDRRGVATKRAGKNSLLLLSENPAQVGEFRVVDDLCWLRLASDGEWVTGVVDELFERLGASTKTHAKAAS